VSNLQVSAAQHAPVSASMQVASILVDHHPESAARKTTTSAVAPSGTTIERTHSNAPVPLIHLAPSPIVFSLTI